MFRSVAIIATPHGAFLHRLLGRAYVGLMLFTSCISILMQARAGSLFLGHFGFIQVFSVLTFVSLPLADIAAKCGRIKTHKLLIVTVFLGAIVFAGLHALLPDRYFYRLLFPG